MSIRCKGGVLKKRMEVSMFFMNDVLSISAKYPLMDWRKELKTYTPIPIDVLGTGNAPNIILSSTNTHVEQLFVHGVLAVGIKAVN